jgi:sterol desaturase/sphingolipid hydroxylase (fatty acid hydroxylase superfamily)
MSPNYIALAVPFFFLLIGIELWIAQRRGRHVYRLTDALGDLGCGITQQVMLLFFGAALLAGYVWIYDHVRLVDLGRFPLLAWIVAFVGIDFTYYWWHRASHRIGVLWAAHVVHHQSEDYNFAVALRQAVLTPITNLPFSLPLAFLGVPPVAYLTAEALSTLYQFWIHTELIGKLGPLEQVINTPSHHRVHHARNPRYLDRNYGAVLIIWDRLFGTFVPEGERPTYGITKPFRSFNALWAQVQPLAALAALGRGAPGWKERVQAYLAPPERHFSWQADADADADADAGAGGGGFARAKHDVPVSRALGRYLLINFTLAIAGTFLLMLFGPSLPARWLVPGVGLVLLSMLTTGGLVEGRRWARPLEVARLAAVAAALIVLCAGRLAR